MIILIDNYDSFSYNLYQLLGEIAEDKSGEEIRVIRNDELSCDEIAALSPSAIIISPGPGKPADAGICEEAVLRFRRKLPILGVCLGHQAICEAYGATVSHAKELMHGKQSETELNLTCPLFHGLNEREPVARYHSLSVVENTLPPELSAAARADDGEIMAVWDDKRAVFGLQFHPESIMTPRGRVMLQNFIALI